MSPENKSVSLHDAVKLLLEADSRWGKGFVMTIKFPVIN